MRRVAAAVGAVAVVALLGAGCGSSSDDEDDAGQKVTATAPAAPAMTDADLEELLLTTSDLGAGWTERPSSGEGDDSDRPSCLRNLPEWDFPSAEASWENDTETTFFAEDLAYAGSEAEDAFEQAVEAMDTCDEVTIDANGQQITGTMEKISLSSAGDESAAYALEFTYQGTTVEFDLVLVRVDRFEMVMVYGEVGSVDTDEVEQLVDMAVEKVAGAEA